MEGARSAFWKPRGCFDRWNAECKSASVVLRTKTECVNVEGSMSCNAREEIGHLDLLEAGVFREEAGEAGHPEGLANREFWSRLVKPLAANKQLDCDAMFVNFVNASLEMFGYSFRVRRVGD